MSSEKPMKLTCFGNGTKKNAYILPSTNLHLLRESVVIYLFGNGEARDFRVYWIDQDNDEIDIVNQSDYEIFLKTNKERLHLYAVAKSENGPNKNQETTSKPNLNGMFPTTASHTHVECDNCKIKPIVGFRYKCIECHNFDLCQVCEAKHVHPDHMMVRMPHSDCPNLIEAWVTGRSKRPHKRGTRGACPILVGAVPDMSSAAAAAPGGGDSERHHRRSHRRRDFNNGVFGHLYKMMVDLAEGGVQVNDEAAASATETAAAGAAAAAGVAANAAKVAAEACATAAASVNETKAENQETKKEQTTTGAVPKTPPSTPSAATGENVQQSTSVPATPSLENLAQLIDPQYMRTGIEILNNFSEMFAKMLDPSDGADVISCPFTSSSNNDTRKNSTTSNVSANSKATTTDQTEQVNAASQASTEKQSVIEVPTSTVGSPVAAVSASAPAASNEQSPERRRSQSIEDNDWQLIDQQPSSTDMNNISTQPTQSFDFAQLSKDLKAHIEEEEKRASELKQPQGTAAATQTNLAATVSTSTTTTTESPVVEPVQQSSAPQPVSQPIPQPRIYEEKRAVPIYHSDPRINNAAHAMMAMGFSNEGGWLTQLLESVNGSIPDALDLMNAAQRNNN